MKVVLADVEESALEETEKELKGRGADVLAVKTDVSKLKDIEALAQKTLDAFGGVHLLFNNAGVQTGVQRAKMFWENTIADWEWVTGVNLWGVIHGIKVFVPIMLQQDTDCHVVNTASIAGLVSSSGIGIYKVTKSAIIMLSETLYLQLRQRNTRIGVTVLCPSGVYSRLNDAERNRPASMQNPPEEQPLTPEQQALLKFFLEINKNAIPSDKFAELVFRAIREDQLYLLSHPESNAFIKQRMDNILQQRNPTLS